MTSIPFEPAGIVDESVDSLIPAGPELIAFVDAVMGGGDVAAARSALESVVGRAGVEAAAGVHGNFEMMNRLADATGIPVAGASLERNAEWIELLGLERWRHV